jgi:beta-galactosidase
MPRLGPDGIHPILDALLAAAGVHSGLPMALRGHVAHTLRYGDDAEFCFLVNLTDDPVAIGDISGSRLAVVVDGETIAPRGVAVLQHSIVDGLWSF